MLCFTGTSRESALIIQEQTRGIERADHGIIQSLHRMKAYAGQMKEDLLKGRIDRMAETLNEGWREKRRTAGSVSNEHIDRLMRLPFRPAQWAVRSGAGGGGFLMLIVDPPRRQHVEMLYSRKERLFSRVVFLEGGAQSWRRTTH